MFISISPLIIKGWTMIKVISDDLHMILPWKDCERAKVSFFIPLKAVFDTQKCFCPLPYLSVQEVCSVVTPLCKSQ